MTPALTRTIAAAAIAAASFATLDRQTFTAAPQPRPDSPIDLYGRLKAFTLDTKVFDVSNVVLKRDRVELTLTGSIYPMVPIDGRVTGAVFIGQGAFHASVPQSDFERAQVRRLLGADAVDSDFRTAVLRFTDDTFAIIDARPRDAAPPDEARRLAAGFGTEWLMEIGANVASRLELALLNDERPGVFIAEVDGGKRGRFGVVLDPHTRIPSATFATNGGEKGIIFQYMPVYHAFDVWMAFYGLGDYERGTTTYSDQENLIDVSHYTLDVDLRDLMKKMTMTARMDFQTLGAGVRAVPFKIGESLTSFEDRRLKKQLRVKAARAEGKPLAFVQEDWEGGFTVFLPQPAGPGQPLSIEVDFEGDFVRDGDIPECFYPESNTAWYPRHGDLDRATYEMTFRHRKRDRVASIGVRVSELPDPADAQAMITKFDMADPVGLAVFAVGPFERKTDPLTPLPSGKTIEFNSVPPRVIPIKDDFIVAELGNALQYFSKMFGQYPYATFGAAFHPYGFGQGFPTLLMIPPTDRAAKNTYVFLAHETAHQWWGNVVAWRSYRDQWLSEGFAEYSGVLYTARRDREQSAAELIRDMRTSLRDPPRTTLGVGKGRLNDIGPIVLGLRLNTSQTIGAYQTLIYNKGALVLRMLHFLLSRPDTGDDTGFVAMMTDFVNRYRNKAASTDDFRLVANEHFARSPIGQKYQLTNLNWFFRQWVYDSGLPSYELDYEVQERPDGIFLTGTLRQDGVPENWFMPLPILMSFDGNQQGRALLRAQGPSTPVELKLPARPKKVELDPNSWVLSEKTITKGKS